MSSPLRARKPQLARCDRPAPRDKVLWVERLKGGERGTFILYSHRPYGYLTHWTAAGTKPCYEDHSLCEGGHSESNLRENFVIDCWHVNRSRRCFVYLTPSAVEQLLAQIGPEESLRGKRIIVIRTARAKGRLSVELDQYSQPQEQLPPEMDPYASVMAFLRAKQPAAESTSLTPSPSRNGVHV